MKDLRFIQLIIKCLLFLHIEVLGIRDAKVIEPGVSYRAYNLEVVVGWGRDRGGDAGTENE